MFFAFFGSHQEQSSFAARVMAKLLVATPEYWDAAKAKYIDFGVVTYNPMKARLTGPRVLITGHHGLPDVSGHFVPVFNSSNALADIPGSPPLKQTRTEQGKHKYNRFSVRYQWFAAQNLKHETMREPFFKHSNYIEFWDHIASLLLIWGK